ncbi:16S rRNA (guanine(966)-N(2))-methyltransferase RsmD [Longivirga aurantiaca]|uniref:16S rRNA (Guanine(966)-N(2))-methyltransferase RsmD n=1 Tax=Longivirga aurantiaca TaxID=1837743 RepID=A0ABW1SZF4_9ACTN
MTRIIAGSARGRRLAVPPSGTRPTADRVREALMSALTHELGSLGGAAVADLYAGTGAVGLEALSRGAAHALLVDKERKAVETLRANVEAVGVPGAVVLADDVVRLTGSVPPALARAPYDLVFADPPYDVADDVVVQVLTGLASHGWLADGALVVVERARPRRGATFAWPDGYEPGKDRTYGETVLRTALWYGRDA